MKRILYTCALLFLLQWLPAQVEITTNTNSVVNDADQIILYLNNTNESLNTKGFGLPSVQNLNNLPYTGTDRPTSKIDALRGMLIFVRATNEAMVFDGQDWSKAFNVEGDNFSRFKINEVTATDGVVNLPINNTIDKSNFLADPLKLKTNVPITGDEINRLYIRQSGVYRISAELVLTATNTSSLSTRFGITVNVNGGKRFDLLENSVLNNANTYMVSLDTSVYVRQGDYLTFATVPDIGGITAFVVKDSSTITIEKIL